MASLTATGPARRTTGLGRYVLAATLARGADAGAAVGLVLLAAQTAHVSNPGLVGGVLVSCLTAPHLLGPVLARQLDRAGDGRGLLAGAFAVFGIGIGVATLLAGHAHVAVVAVPVGVSGLCGPLLTGGLSSRLGPMVAPDERAQRRAQGWDSLSYGIGGTAGPTLVAAAAGTLGPRPAMLVMTGAAVLAAVVVLLLPRGYGPAVAAREVPPVRQTLALIARTGPLRRVMYATAVTAIPAGAIAVLAVGLGHDLRVGTGQAAFLAAAFGCGNLLGSLVLTAHPLLGEPERLVTRGMLAIGCTLGLCALAPTYPLAVAAFALVGVANAPYFTATIAARAAYAPESTRAQVFVSMAALKVAAAAAGTAAAGAALALGPRPLLAAGAVAVVATAGAMTLERRYATGRRLLGVGVGVDQVDAER